MLVFLKNNSLSFGLQHIQNKLDTPSFVSSAALPSYYLVSIDNCIQPLPEMVEVHQRDTVCLLIVVNEFCKGEPLSAVTF